MTIIVEIDDEVVDYGENVSATFYSVSDKNAEYIEMHVHEWKAVFRIMNHGHNWVFEPPLSIIKLVYNSDEQLFEIKDLPKYVTLIPVATKDFSKVPITIDGGKNILGRGVGDSTLY